MKPLKEIKAFAKDGLFHIFGSSVLAQVCGLISSMVVIRALPKTDYGFYVSANNVYSYLAVFIGLGLTSAVIQFCSERISEQRKGAIYRHSLILGGFGNVGLLLLIVCLSYAEEACGNYQVAYYLRLMAGLPFAVYANSYLQTVLRVKLKNRAFSYANIIYSLFTLVGNIVFTRLIGIAGLILTMYLANLAAAAKCAISLRGESFFAQISSKQNRLPEGDKSEITKYALTCALTNFSSTALILLDVTCLDITIGSYEVLADYQVASTIPAACAFVPSCLMTFFYPKLVDAFSNSKEAGRLEVKRLTKIFLAVNGTVYGILAFCAPFIIFVAFGEKYVNVVAVFELLSVNYFFYSYRVLFGNVIASIKHVKINLLLSIISGLLKIALNLLLIHLLASMGAALATVLVTAFIDVLSYAYLQRFFKQE